MQCRNGWDYADHMAGVCPGLSPIDGPPCEVMENAFGKRAAPREPTS